MAKRFQPVPGPFGGTDEQATQDAFVEFMAGVAGAERMDYLYKWSYPSGTQYDKLMKNGRYHSKDDNFRMAAKREGFTDEQVDAFLML